MITDIYNTLFSSIDRLIAEKDKVIVAIDGTSASGKTTLTSLITETYRCNVFSMDDFFLRPHQRTVTRLSDPGGNVDYERFREDVLNKLIINENFFYAPYCCKTQSLLEPIHVEPLKLNIVEGVYSMHPYLASCYDLKVFLEIEPQAQIVRIMKRNNEHMYKRFIEEWIPMERVYFKEMNIKGKCDLCFS